MCVISCSDVWRGTSGTSRDVPAVGLESLSGLKMCCEKNLKKEKKKERERERERETDRQTDKHYRKNSIESNPKGEKINEFS